MVKWVTGGGDVGGPKEVLCFAGVVGCVCVWNEFDGREKMC